MSLSTPLRIGIAGLLVVALGLLAATVRSDTVFFAGTPPTIAQVPLHIQDSVPPLNMLVMGKDHKIYYEAYNDASDLDGDGILDVGYKGWELKSPAPTDGSSRYKIDYYGYFNSYACYSWQTDRFVPVSEAPDKTCSRRWSGDFLNYLTMSRMDALRRVLYGGWRHVDTSSETVLQGAFFPQDAHSWGKEYQSEERDGYAISDYAPLDAPENGRYHLFAVTTTTDTGAAFPNYTAPRFRVLEDSPFRVWEWVSIEGPVANRACIEQGISCVGESDRSHPGHPGNRSDFDTIESTYAVPAGLYGTSSLDRIDCTSDCNLRGGDDNYLSIFTGQLRINSGRGGTYQFRVYGDDAIDFVLTNSSGMVVAQAGCYNGRGFNDPCTGNQETAAVTLSEGTYNLKFRHEEEGGGDGYRLQWRKTGGGNQFNYANLRVRGGGVHSGNGGLEANLNASFYDLAPTIVGASAMADYFVRVRACPGGDANSKLRESLCKAYGSAASPIYKPTGILHDYGEARKMFFGLITGSQANNLEGGVLRSNIEDFNREIDSSTGVFRTDVEGIVRSIDRLRMIGGGYDDDGTDNLTADHNWNWANSAHSVGGNCVSQGGRAVNNGECRMWGNPIAEMLFEGLRYFAGASAATARFATGGSAEGRAEDARLGLPTPAWRNPYADTVVDGVVTRQAYPSCARPHQTIISDINPSYDGNLPGSEFDTTGADAALPGLDVASQGQDIWDAEFGAARSVFIGEVDGQVTDGAPTAKSVSSFGNIRGLAPEEPTKQGTYYSASVARYGRNLDVNAAERAQYVSTYSIALASPLPRIEFPVGGQTVTLLPFAKTVSGTFGEEQLKPTNTIVDFYVESFENFPGQPVAVDDDGNVINGGRPRAIFRINYEDVEQGNDHDMDVIGRYVVTANSDNTVTINLSADYAAGSANQNVGYVISGTTRDGIYLEVRDRDNTSKTSSAYELNTPPGRWAGECVGAMSVAPCNQGLEFTASRTFTPGAAAGGIQLKDPLWYAAKYGSPDAPGAPPLPGREPQPWDADEDGEPDNYFLVTNPLNLRAQLSAAFDDISGGETTGSSRALTGARVNSSTFTLLPSFHPGGTSRQGKDWTGDLQASAVTAEGALATPELWNAQDGIPAHGARNIRTATRAGVRSTRTAVEFLGGNDNLGIDDASRLARLGVTGPLASLPNDYGAVYTAEAIVNYLRGDQSREAGRAGEGNTLRARSSVLGDIVNSEPIIASPRSDFGYGSYSDTMFSGYGDDSGYLEQKATRDTVVYVGANDGMLHAFNGNTMPCASDATLACRGVDAGEEMFAFIPNASLSRLGELALPDALYEHRYYVDGQITVTDAKDGAAWKTILVGSMGGGGRSVFALDVSDPDGFGDDDVLWELNGQTDHDIGHVYGRPLLLPLENNRWGVLFGNGYGGSTSDPSLYVVDAFTGEEIAKLTADDGNPARASSWIETLICTVDVFNLVGSCANNDDDFNGLGQITAIDRDGNGKADTVYGGDLQGNLWKFDLSDTSAGAWDVGLGGQPLVTAIASNGERQPITGGMRISAGPGAGVMVYFGTGRYFVEGDNDIPQPPDVQSLYGVFDNGTPIEIEDEDEKNVVLQRQWIQLETNDAGVTTRDISGNRVSYYGNGAKRGWYLDLVIDNADGDASGGTLSPVGERFIATPRIQNGRVFFTTFSPTGSSCDPGGTNIIYVLDLLSGSGALTNVRTIGSEDAACTGENCGAVEVPGSGAPITSTSVAAISPTRFVENPACNPATENCPTFEECQVVIYPGAFVLPRPCGRQSWRQLK